MNIGNYKIIKQIAEGGFGRTYEARHIYLDEKACLKQNINITPADAKLLLRESKLLWNVHHYSLPAMRDYFPLEDGSFAMVMSFVEGKTLESSIKKHQAIHPEEISWITQRLLNALHYLHDKGVVHCDIKPSNIMIQLQDHNAILVDYGLSSLQPKKDTKALGLTKVWAAPELELGKPPIPATDLYSLGLTMLYAMGGDPITKTFSPSTPAQLKKFFGEMIEYDPRERPDWKKQDLVKRLSDIRLEVFGRRHT
jgi:serine/threonine protein kinase